LNSVIAGRYHVTEYLCSDAFSKVVQALDLQTGMDVCLKIIKNDKDLFDQSLNGIKLLKFVNKYDPLDEHHVLHLYDYFYYHVYITYDILSSQVLALA
jgi:serine/threonine protein kinase